MPSSSASSRERLLGRLAGADLAAWELPQPGHRLALRAACDEHPVVAIDQGGSGDKEEGQAIGKVVREPARRLKSGPDLEGPDQPLWTRSRHRAGESPNSRLNARLKASSDS